jgi:hypothetical protein
MREGWAECCPYAYTRRSVVGPPVCLSSASIQPHASHPCRLSAAAARWQSLCGCTRATTAWRCGTASLARATRARFTPLRSLPSQRPPPPPARGMSWRCTAWRWCPASSWQVRAAIVPPQTMVVGAAFREEGLLSSRIPTIHSPTHAPTTHLSCIPRRPFFPTIPTHSRSHARQHDARAQRERVRRGPCQRRQPAYPARPAGCCDRRPQHTGAPRRVGSASGLCVVLWVDGVGSGMRWWGIVRRHASIVRLTRALSPPPAH